MKSYMQLFEFDYKQIPYVIIRLITKYIMVFNSEMNRKFRDR